MAVSEGKAAFYVGTLFASKRVRLGFRLLIEAVSGPRVAIRFALGTSRTHGGIKAREVHTEGERVVPFGEAFGEVLPPEWLSLPLGQF
jgi:hypothetical protein